jgi:hypothetical protein
MDPEFKACGSGSIKSYATRSPAPAQPLRHKSCGILNYRIIRYAAFKKAEKRLKNFFHCIGVYLSLTFWTFAYLICLFILKVTRNFSNMKVLIEKDFLKERIKTIIIRVDVILNNKGS